MRRIVSAIAAIACTCGLAAASEPTIDTIAGGGASLGDGGPAKEARFGDMSDVAVDTSGNVYVADLCRIRKISATGIITTIAGNGSSSGTGLANGAVATSASICTRTVAVDAFGYVYFSSWGRLGKVSPSGTITLVAGTGTSGYSGDGGAATSAKIGLIEDITFDAAGNAYIADGYRVRKIATTGIITTVAGNGNWSETGDYGPATATSIAPTELAFDPAGNLFIVDQNSSYSIRKVDLTGMISRVWGKWPQYRSDPIALNTSAYNPTGLAADANGNLYVSNRAAFVSLVGTNGALKHVVGVFIDTTWGYGALDGFEGDGGPAQIAKLREPQAIAMDSLGNLYIADKGNLRIRKVTGSFPPPTLPAGAYAFDHATPMHLVSPNQYTVGIVSGDANGDSRTDLFVLTGSWDRFNPYPGDYALYLYRQNPDGTLAAPMATPVPHIQLNDVMAVDLNHDDYIDIVFTGDDYSGVNTGLFVMLGGVSGMAAPVRYEPISGALALQQADMNGDGHMDVLAGGIYYGNGMGALVATKSVPPVSAGYAPLMHDFNGDGRPDLLWGWDTQTDSGIAVAYHDGIDNFSPPITFPGAGAPKRSGFWPVIGDFDSDGIEEVIFSIDANAPNAKLTRWIHTPGGGFEYAGEWSTYDVPQTLISADMNNDGLDDLLVRHSGWSSVGYLQQTRMDNGTFWLDREVKAYASVYNQAQQHSMTVGDFNSDDCLDIAVSGTNSGLQIQYGRRCFRFHQSPDDAPLPPHSRGNSIGTPHTSAIASPHAPSGVIPDSPSRPDTRGATRQTKAPVSLALACQLFTASLIAFLGLWWLLAWPSSPLKRRWALRV